MLATMLRAQRFGEAWPNVVNSLSPTAWWRLGEPSGTNAVDETTNYGGTYTNTPTLNQAGLIQGSSDKCIRLDGTNEFVDIGNVLNPGASDFSVVIWINSDDITTTTQRLIQKRGTGAYGTSSGWQISTSGGSGWSNTAIDIGDGSYSNITSTSYRGVTDGNVFMIALTWSNSNERMRLYVNDTLHDTGTVTGTMAGKSITTTRPMTIGCSDDGGGTRSQFFDGFLDEAVFFLGTELTGTEVSNLYSAGS